MYECIMQLEKVSEDSRCCMYGVCMLLPKCFSIREKERKEVKRNSERNRDYRSSERRRMRSDKTDRKKKIDTSNRLTASNVYDRCVYAKKRGWIWILVETE